ncbi:MAG: flagellar basal body-associated FliL family protein, partial [Lachnospiraceae bacterium]
EYNVYAGETLTINLKKGSDGKDHFAVLSVTLSLDMTSDGYKTYGETLADRDATIRNEINNVIMTHTMEELKNNTADIQTEIVDSLQTLFDSDFIIGVGFGSMVCQ